MKEPNLDGMIDFLLEIGSIQDEFLIDRLLDLEKNGGRNISMELEQLLYFCRSEQASTVENAIAKIVDKEKSSDVLFALVSLYPITRSIVIQMLKKADVAPSDILKLYDIDNNVLETIHGNINLIKESSKTNNLNVNKYEGQISILRGEINQLGADRERLKSSIEGYAELINRKTTLESEIDELNRMKASDIEQEIRKLKNQKIDLEGEIEERKKEKERLTNEIEKIKTELDKSPNSKSGECKQALNALQNCIKKITK